MRPAAFEFHAPTDLAQALALLAELGPEATPLAGGQTLLPLLNMRLVRPAHVVDMNRVSALSFIDARGDGLRIGAMTRQYQIEHSAEVRERCPLLAHAMPFVGHTQTRSRGTLGGSLAFASSVAELGVVLLAVGANVHIAGSAGNRTVSIDGFFLDYLTSALQAGELLTEVTVHGRGKNTRWGFSELKLRSCDFPIVVAAATVALDDSGRCVEARIALGGAAPTPVRVPQAESELIGQVLSPRVVEAAARAARDAAAEPTEDLRASAAYRRAMVPLQVSQALTMALEGKH